MKKESLALSFILLFFLVVGCKALPEEADTPSEAGFAQTGTGMQSLHQDQFLDSLLIHHQYFELRDQISSMDYRLPELSSLFYRAQLQAAFNQRKESNRNIELILHQFPDQLNDLKRVLLLETAAANSLFLFDYQKALHYTQLLLDLELVEGQKRKEHLNNLRIYQALRRIPPQRIHLAQSTLPIEKDLAGLSRVPVTINTFPQQVVFDTGANFSVITDSLALKAGMEIHDTQFKVTAITGKEINSRIAVARELILGNSRLHNVVFLVFPQESLSFPQIDYTIDAILGFPVINALGQIQLVNQEEFLITLSDPKETIANLALDFLTPLVKVLEKDQTLTFTFDTGANTTSLYSPYFDLHSERILEASIQDTVHIGGAGGVMSIPVYLHPFSAQIGNSQFTLDRVPVYKQNIKPYPGIHGNLGQDILSQFDTLKLDFKHMQLELQ